MIVSYLAEGFATALTPENLLYCFLGVVLGTLVGVLPGLGNTAAIAILIPITSGLNATTAIIMLAGIYYGAMYGGSTTAILINIPGEGASVPTAMDGYSLARQGRAGPALGISAIASFIAGTVSLFLLMLLAPPLASGALAFGPPEYFALMLLGLTIIVSLAEKSLIKGLISGMFGILVATVGMDPVTGQSRFTYGNANLMAGIDFISVVVGLFAIPEVLVNLEREAAKVYETRLAGIYPTLKELRRCTGAFIRGSLIGFFTGVLPGNSLAVASFLAYDFEKKSSRYPEKFGTGMVEGVAASEGANNAAANGGMVPLLTLGIPASSSLAVLMGAFLIHGLRPGPLLFTQNPEFVWALIASMYIGNIMLLVLNLPLIGLWARLVWTPYPILSSTVLLVCVLGTYSIRNNFFDVWVMIAFGILGYFMRKLEIPAAPLMLALILAPLMENALVQSLTISGGSPMVFLTRPMSLTLVLLAVASLIVAVHARRRWGQPSALSVQET